MRVGPDGAVLDGFVGGRAVAELFEQGAAVVGGEGREGEFGHPDREAVEAGNPLLDGGVPVFQRAAARDDLGGEEGGGLFVGRVIGFFFGEREVAETALAADQDTAGGVVVEGFLDGGEIGGELLL